MELEKKCNCDSQKTHRFSNILQSIIRSLQCPENDIFINRFTDRLNCLILLGGDSCYVHDLSNFSRLISLIFERIDTNPIYQESLYKILLFCSQSFTFVKSSEIMSFANDIQDFFSMLGFLLGSTQNIKIVRVILECLVKTISAAKNKAYSQATAVLDCFANSQAPMIIAELLLLSEFDIYVEYLLALEEMFVSRSICQAFLKYNTLNTVMRRLCHNWKDYLNYSSDELPNIPLPEHLNLSQRIMWTLTIAYNESPKSFTNSINCTIDLITARSARNILITLITSNKDRHMRNMFYLLLITITATVPYEYYSLLANELHLITFMTEVPQLDCWAPQMRSDKLDFEFKLLLFATLCLNKDHPQSLDTFRKMNTLEGIFILLSVDAKLIWSNYQRLELMKCALIALEIIIPYTVEDFVHHNGPSRLLTVISHISQSTLPLSLLLPTLRCINTSLNVQRYSTRKMARRYRVKRITESLTVVLQSMLKSPYLTKMNQTTLAVIFCILEKVVKRSEDKYIEVTKIGMVFLKRFLNPDPKDSFVPPKVLIAIMSFIWESVVRCMNGMKEFLSLGGVYLIMDIIDKFPLAIKVLGLSILCDLCEKEECLPCILTWRGISGQTIIPLLLKIYRNQAQFDQDNTDLKFTLQDVENPLVGEKLRNIRLKYYNNEHSSIITLDTLGNCKPKIYTILYLLSCSKYKPLIDSDYKISRNSLTNEENIIAVLAENYFPLKVGEAWVEVNHHFEFTGVRPLVFDQEMIAARIKQYRNQTRFVKMQQLFYQMKDTKHDIKLELELYNKLRDEVLSESLEAMNELSYYAKCVDAMFRLRECAEINNETERILADKMDESWLIESHKTIPQYLNTTKVFNQQVSIQSNVVIDPNEEEVPDPVSLESLTEYSNHLHNFIRRYTQLEAHYDVTRASRSDRFSVDYH